MEALLNESVDSLISPLINGRIIIFAEIFGNKTSVPFCFIREILLV